MHASDGGPHLPVGTNSKTVLATAGGLLAIVLWSGTFALARSLSEKLGPLTAGTAVYVAGTVFCAVQVVFAKRGDQPRARQSAKYLFGCGALFGLYTLVIYLAVGLARDRLQLLEVALINYLWPAGTVLLSLPLLNQRASVVIWPATAMALAGVFLVMTQGADLSWSTFRNHIAESPAVFGLALAGAVSWALYSNLARRWSRPGASGGVVFFMVAATLLLLGARFAFPETSTWSPRALCEVLVLGGITAVAYGLWDVSMRRGNLNLVAAASYATPLLSTLVSFLYLQVAPGTKLWAGCALIVLGSLASWRAVKSQAPIITPEA
jgi:drug/metabolite transporter (DMT)-like permease